MSLFQNRNHLTLIDFYGYPVKNSPNVSMRLPVNRAIFSKSIKLHHLSNGQKTEIDGYLKYSPRKTFPAKIKKALIEHNKDFSYGFTTYNFYTDLTKIPTETMMLGKIEDSFSLDLPYNLKVTKLGTFMNKVVFSIDDFEPTTISIPEIQEPFPTLSHKDMIKAIVEVSSISMKNKHTADSILAPFIGSKFIKTITDGVGSSYLFNSRLQDDLLSIKESLNDSNSGLPLNHLGIQIFLNGDPLKFQKMREYPESKKFTNISWNLPSSSRPGVGMKLSEFKYAGEEIGVTRHRDLRNNVEFQHSIIKYATGGGKGVSEKLFRKSMITASKELEGWFEDARHVITQIFDLVNLEEQVGRIAYYYQVFGKDEKKVVNKVKDAISRNITGIIDKLHIDKSKWAYRHEKEFDPRIRIAFHSSDTTKEGFAEKLMGILGYSEKKAKNTVEELIKKGLIFSIDGKHYRWHSESKFNFILD